jgi:D-hydroxyproline dehydrogenase subunit alpha
MPTRTDIAIIGGGPAGLSTAVEAINFNLDITLVDSYPKTGGQYFKQPPDAFKSAPPVKHGGADLLKIIDTSTIHVYTNTSVWSIFPEEDGYLVCMSGPDDTPRRILARKVILAPGAYARPVPFPGWTLPGVMNTGAAMNLIRNQGILPGKRVLISGTCPMQMLLAAALIRNGAEVVGFLEINPLPWRHWKRLPSFWGQWERMIEGAGAVKTMFQSHLGVQWEHTIYSAEGDGKVERAIIGPVNGSGQTSTVEIDAVCLGYGFIPSIQLSTQLGCKHSFHQLLKCYIPQRNEWLETTRHGVFMVGDGASFGGKDVAQLEGRLAAIAAARQLNHFAAPSRVDRLRKELITQYRYVRNLGEMFAYRQEIGKLITDDTIICRCEEVTAGQIREAIAQGAESVSAVKNITRAGMGNCQGRMCGDSIAYLISQQTGKAIQKAGRFMAHAPVVPIRLKNILEE